MKGTIILAATLLTTLAVTGVMNPSRSIAVPTSGIEVMERIGHGGSTYDTADGMVPGRDGCTLLNPTGVPVDVIERIGHGGSTYSSSRLTSDQPVSCTGLQANVNIEGRIGHGGSTYPYGVTMTD
ncbi:MAG: hypothetical protein OEU68_18410 [Nitrospira sp.]|nr:hypothetical protein [Nitrospira sp.]MDH4358208.1 hypothetical protein [Nitrospira sp.]MDH5318935.1 hypothetical protein [Nitrospira sp.]